MRVWFRWRSKKIPSACPVDWLGVSARLFATRCLTAMASEAGSLAQFLRLCFWACLCFSFSVLAADPPRRVAHDADIYLVPVGPTPDHIMQGLAQRYRDVASLQVEVLAPLPVPDHLVDSFRKQLVAEKSLHLMEQLFEHWKHRPLAVVVGVTPFDMYIANSGWRYAFAYGHGQYALVSAARMGDAFSTESKWSEWMATRVQKMVDKRIAVQYFQMGVSRPMPNFLSTPVLGPEDLDRMPAEAITRALTEAAAYPGSFVRGPKEPPQAMTLGDTADAETDWLTIAVVVIGIVIAFITIFRVLRKDELAGLEDWRSYAEKRGWKFTQHGHGWFMPIPFSMEGEIEGIPFAIHWYQEGIGKNARQKTHLLLQHSGAKPFSITPRSWLLSGMFARQKIKTRDRAYDCRFVVRSQDANWVPTSAMRRQHLSYPVEIFAQGDGLHFIHKGWANMKEAEHQIELARSWLAHLLGKGDVATDRSNQGVSAIGCWFGEIVSLVFWVGVLCSALLFFVVAGGEETNRPWEIAFNWLLPLALIVWPAWAIWITARKGRGAHLYDVVVGKVVVGPMLIAVLIWGLAGPWVLAWNAISGAHEDQLVLGTVLDLREYSRRGNTSYFVKFRDIAEQREVEIQTNQETYEGLRIGDPVGFHLRRGGLGMYYLGSPTLDAISAWLDNNFKWPR